MSDTVKIHKREWLRKGFLPVLRTLYSHLQFDGAWSKELDREIVHRGNIVTVLPYDSVADKYVLIKQFRIGAYWARAKNENKSNDGLIWEAVSGYVDAGESIEEAAKREMMEESGLTCSDLKSLGSVLTSPGMCDERVHLFLASVDSQNCEGIFGLESESENIQVHALERKTVQQMILDGRIEKASALLALHRAEEILSTRSKIN
ncbi:MAG: NUDIX domain-containing protein [Proteobacteria bacterium]|nr:NUDIX domain-containing protein [Pseudomonadota bacterium]